MDLKFLNDYFTDNQEVEELSKELNFALTELNNTVNLGSIQRLMRLNAVLNEMVKKEASQGVQTSEANMENTEILTN